MVCMYVYRCQCGQCAEMPTAVECVCCQEHEQIQGRIAENENEVPCIIDHDGFEAVCLNRWVLQTGFFQYRQQYGTSDIRSEPVHE